MSLNAAVDNIANIDRHKTLPRHITIFRTVTWRRKLFTEREKQPTTKHIEYLHATY